MIQVHQPLIEIFGDINYAWQLLEGEVKLETADNVTGEDIAHLLQLYMRGVEKMNSMIDFRESFFKNRVTTLMSRPTVIKSLNKPMSKKTHQAPVVESIPVKKVDNRAELQLQQKKRQMQMRIAYGAEEHNPDALKKMLNEHTQKQYIITKKIHNIVNEHDERLMKRIKERKLKTMTLKSRSDMYMNNDTTESSGLDGQDRRERKEMIERRRDQEQFGGIGHENGAKENGAVKKDKTIRKIKSLEPKRTRFKDEPDSPVKRRVSIDFVDKRKV